MLLSILLIASTAVIAGLVPTLLFFGTAADRKVLLIGGVATAAAYIAVAAGARPIVQVTVNGFNVYPVWAVVLAFVIATIWRLVSMAAPPPRSEEERIAEIRERARKRARRRRPRA